MGNNTTKDEPTTSTTAITLDNDDRELESDKAKFNNRLRLIDSRLEIIDQIRQTNSDVFILSIESLNFQDKIDTLLTVQMLGEINPHQFSIERIQHPMAIPNWPNKPTRTTLSIRRMALKKMGKGIYFRGFCKIIIVIIATYISFLLWSINR